MAKIIRDGGYAMEMEALYYELKAAKVELQLQRKELLRKNDLLQQRDEQLKKRTEVCNYHCEFDSLSGFVRNLRSILILWFRILMSIFR